MVAPEARRRGIGTALLRAVEDRCRELGRTRLLTSAVIGEAAATAAPDQVLVPPTGAGRVPAQDPSSLFALASGFRLEQSERHSVLDLSVRPTDRTDEVRTDPDYTLRSWSGPTPEELLAPMCRLRSQMSVDVPTGEVTYEREHWDADRIRAEEAKMDRFGHVPVTTVAVHRDSGEIAAYTTLECARKPPEVAYQADTFVLAAHRGHGLGMSSKRQNLNTARKQFPRLLRIHTWNADENEWMLAINIALGFAPRSLETAWSRAL